MEKAKAETVKLGFIMKIQVDMLLRHKLVMQYLECCLSYRLRVVIIVVTR